MVRDHIGPGWRPDAQGDNMAVTRVVCAHLPGPLQNGEDGCFARAGNNGVCPGIATAKWLNSLGDDDAHYTSRITNLEVRLNYIKTYLGHVVAAQPCIIGLLQDRVRLRKQLKDVGRRLKAAGYNAKEKYAGTSTSESR